MTDVGRRRLRLAAGLTLLALAALVLGIGANAELDPDREPWAAGLGVIVIVIGGVPTLLAAVAVLLGGTKGGVFGGVVSLCFGGFFAWLILDDIARHMDLTRPPYGVWADDSLVFALVEAAIAVAYAFAGIASLLTRHARDKPPA